jgi:hypothetical protein
MDMERMLIFMEHMLVNQMLADLEEMKGQAAASHKETDATAEASQERKLAFLEGSRSCGKRMMAFKRKTTSCPNNSKAGLEEMEAANMEAYPKSTEAAVVRQELRMEVAYVDAVGPLDDRNMDRCLNVRHRRLPRRKIHRAVPAARKGHMYTGPGRDSAVRGIPKMRPLETRRQACPECNSVLKGGGYRYDRGCRSLLAVRLAVKQTLELRRRTE